MSVQPHPTSVVLDNKDNRINYVNGIKEDAQAILTNLQNHDGLDAGYAKKIISACTSLTSAMNHFKGVNTPR